MGQLVAYDGTDAPVVQGPGGEREVFRPDSSLRERSSDRTAHSERGLRGLQTSSSLRKRSQRSSDSSLREVSEVFKQLTQRGLRGLQTGLLWV